MTELSSGWIAAALAALALLHAAAPEHDHPFRMLALRRGAGRSWACGWSAVAALLHLGTSLVVGWLAYHAGVGILALGGLRALELAALGWCLLYGLLVGAFGFSGHLQSPRTSLLRLEERRMKSLTPAALVSIEGLNPCLLPWALWALAAPSGLGATLLGATAWSLGVSATALVKLFVRFPRHPRPWLGPLERHGDVLAALLAALLVGSIS